MATWLLSRWSRAEPVAGRSGEGDVANVARHRLVDLVGGVVRRDGRGAAVREMGLRPHARAARAGGRAVMSAVRARYGEYRRQRLPSSQVHQRGVGEVHRSVVVPDHERLDGGLVAIVDRKHGDCARADEASRCRLLAAAVPHEANELGQHRGRRRQGKTQRRERLHARPVPAIIAIEERDDRPRLDQPSSGHGVPPAAPEPPTALVPPAADSRRAACRTIAQRRA